MQSDQPVTPASMIERTAHKHREPGSPAIGCVKIPDSLGASASASGPCWKHAFGMTGEVEDNG
jgi:hypothetical protein